MGSLDVTKVSVVVLDNFIIKYKAFSVPYLFRDRADAFKVYDRGIGKSLLTKGGQFTLRRFSFHGAGVEILYQRQTHKYT